jgi:hypothetical protein
VHDVLESDADFVFLVGLLEVEQSVLEEDFIQFEQGFVHQRMDFILQVVI